MKRITLIYGLAIMVMVVVTASFYYIRAPFRDTNNAIVLNAPDLYQPGELIILDASASNASQLKWGLLPNNNNMHVTDSGKRAVFSSNGKYKVYTVVISAYINGELVQHFHTLTLGYDSNIAVTDLQEKIISWLPDDRTHDEVIKLALSFNSIARVIENGTLTTSEDIVEATAWSTTDALGDSIDKWKPFLKSLQDYLEASPPSNHALTWREIARALEASDGAA